MDTRVKPLDTGASVGRVAAVEGDLVVAGRISGSSIATGRLDPDLDAAHAKAIELLGPGTVTRDMITAIVKAAYGRRL